MKSIPKATPKRNELLDLVLDVESRTGLVAKYLKSTRDPAGKIYTIYFSLHAVNSTFQVAIFGVTYYRTFGTPKWSVGEVSTQSLTDAIFGR